MECGICFEPMDIYITVGCCKKQIHFDCFIKCIKEHQRCPYCRHPYENPFNENKEQTVVQLVERPLNTTRKNKVVIISIGICIFFSFLLIIF